MPAYQYQGNTIAFDASAAAAEYFAHMNPIARRIARDILETKLAYAEHWCTLNTNEQNDIINETLIKPEISLRYFDSSLSTSSTSASGTASATQSPHSSPAPSSTGSTAHILGAKHNGAVIDSSGSGGCGSGVANSIAYALKHLSSNNTASAIESQHQQQQKLSAKGIPKAKQHHAHTVDLKHCYAYDGRALRTYALQKVGMKIVRDEVLGNYRDEHSYPFSYRTKSQINLQLFPNGGEEMMQSTKKKQTSSSSNNNADEEMCLLTCVKGASAAAGVGKGHSYPSKEPRSDQMLANYKKLQTELKMNLSNHFDSKAKKTKKSKTKIPSTQYERLPNVRQIDVPAQQPTQASNLRNMKTALTKDCKAKSTNANVNGHGHSHGKKITLPASAAAAPTTNANVSAASMTYAVYTDAYYEYEESANLMQHCNISGNGVLIASSSASAATSDEDDERYDFDDEKTLCEDMKLLDTDLNIRCGFDFLNNW